ncbi:Unconventional myosin-Vb [Acipenser ruthenus]|uniref:Unconventional myosin-Vb n=1 Tax=Acipenser ruthenus TaxID=7906 RepID=A0A662YSN4_ACIRT|nr:Unconventional myosin-Vb [Acipenser ruthenus]
MPSSLYHPDIMEGELIVSSHHGGGMTTETEDGHQRDEQHQEALRFALDQLSLIGLEDRGECGGTGETDPTLVGLDDGSCNGVGVGFIGLQMMEHPGGPSSSPTSCSPPPDIFGPGFHMAAQHQHSILGEQVNVIGCRKRSVNMTECVPVPSSEHVAEIVGRQDNTHMHTLTQPPRNCPGAMSAADLYTKLTRVWVPDPEQVWVPAQLSHDYRDGDDCLHLQLSDGTEVQYVVAPGPPPGLPPLRNPDILEGENDLTALSYLHEPAVLHNLRVRFLDYSSIYTYCGEQGEVQYVVAPGPPPGLPPLRNPDILEGENDLTALSYLHEPAVLHNLRVRFLDYIMVPRCCSIILVAINPYEQLPIYGEDVIDAYSGQNMADMDPHIFSVAEEAYRQMAREEKNQSIIISGESGAGKTVSAKFTMRYFAAVGGSARETSVEERVLESNPIMEAIGNAKTTRNDNSSRFGKYIEIGFGRKGDIIGANMRTYLLEKSRVVFQTTEERNYHIFYQLCASRHLPELSALGLRRAEEFQYTSQGGNVQIPGTDDAADLERTRNSFSVLGVRPGLQMELFRILAAILHLGNVRIQSSGRDGERCSVNAEDRSLHLFCQLLAVERSQMAHWLCHRRLAVAGEMLVKPMGWQQACEARDALSKHVYGQLFTWTVGRLNGALRAQRRQPHSFIGVLDIYGFETFEKNSFEQFCINYANEKLQQQFNRHVFQLEQEEYLREEIPWTRIEFSDNQPCIELIEGKLGVLDLLDEECRMPRGSDESWAQKLYERHQNQNPHFSKPRLSNTAFIILHFADTVQYECDGFLDKNRDTVFEEPINILKASKSELVAELFQDEAGGDGPPLPGVTTAVPNGSLRSSRKGGSTVRREHKQTVGFQFRQSLQLLMGTLNSTTPHYVRCIKPNDLKQPFLFDPKRAVQQLRACGVLETIRISAAGYPSRWTYPEFFKRYRVMMQCRDPGLEDRQAACRAALGSLILDPDQYRFGKTKIFFRAGQVALLEKLRASRLRAACVEVQRRVRGWLERKRYQHTRQAALTLQNYTRGWLARRLAHSLRYTRAALVLQKSYRMVQVRRLYLLIRSAAVTIQAFARGALARCLYRQLRAERTAVLLQARVRGWSARRSFLRVRGAVLYLQCCYRRMRARRELKQRRMEARSVEHYRQLNKGMEVKLMQLQRRADEQSRESSLLKERLSQERAAHCTELARLQGELSRLAGSVQDEARSTALAQELSALRGEREREREEQRSAEQRAAQEITRLTQAVESLQREKAALIQEREKLNTSLQEHERAREERLSQQVALAVESLQREKAALIQEREKLNTSLQEHERAREERLSQQVALVSSGLRAELEEERGRYQGLLKEFSRLEQRYENLKDEMTFSERFLGHRRNASSQSLILDISPPIPAGSSEREARTSVTSPERQRRVTVTSPELERRVTMTSPERVRRVTVTSPSSPIATSPADSLLNAVGLFKDGRMREEDLRHAYDAVRVANKFLESQLVSQRQQWDSEMEALRLQVGAQKEEMDRQSQALAHTLTLPPGTSLQLGLQEQLAHLAADNLRASSDAPELVPGTLKQIRFLESQLVSQRQQWDSEMEALRLQVGAQKEEMDRQSQALAHTLTLPPGTSLQLGLQEQLAHLAADNLEQVSRRLRRELHSLKQAGWGSAGPGQSEFPDRQAWIIIICDDPSLSLFAPFPFLSLIPARGMEVLSGGNAMPAPHKEAKLQGLLECRREDEARLIKNLITGLRPEVTRTLTPGLPAHILFLCMRQADWRGEEQRARALCTATVTAIKGALKSSQTDEQTLLTFDPSDLRKALSDLSIQTYQQLIRIAESRLQPMIVPAMLESETIPGLSSGGKSLGSHKRAASGAREKGEGVQPHTMDSLLRELSSLHHTLSHQALHPEVCRQAFRQISHLLTATTLNNLLLRKDMCSWSKGLQIRYNVSQLEDWLRGRSLQLGGAVDSLEPLIQAAQLLQVSKRSESDARAIEETCTALSPPQIVKILSLYTPLNEFEERVTLNFIRSVQALLNERPGGKARQLLMDVRHVFPVTFPPSLSPSPSQQPEQLQIPDSLNLAFLRRV